ncbi:hypothetical protein CEUSTIGMA_g1769.t1 [Chlamydomonas eustigma]|uniref:Uncharacterized protein n=1 Tax=Chlamydomonas eustigma TaxID=1157962 RepID=A0A250WUU7_9CHLO|nr:hypothetical protein CEUSTIGMA_g1769.t1 [Chlamydomonas eustigma]|eukprot:GAX74320.1 hypothetical protein CEUSTIGMA_g1769.t1 [Chlamydomonas eustigma]
MRIAYKNRKISVSLVEFVQAELEEGDEYAAGDGSSSAANTERSVSLSYHTAVPESGVGQVNPLIRQFNLGHTARIAVETVTSDSTPVPRSAMQPGAMNPQNVSNMSVMQPHPSGMQITPEVVDHQSGNPLAVRNQRGSRSFAFAAPVPMEQPLMSMPQHAYTNPVFQHAEFTGYPPYHQGTAPVGPTWNPPPPPSRSAVSFQQIQNPPAPPMVHNPVFSDLHDNFVFGMRFSPDRNINLWLSSLVDPMQGVEFAYAHMEVIEKMCPGATVWFEHTVSNLGMEVRSGVGETLNAIKALRSRVFDALGNAVDRVREDSAYPKKQLQFLEAWLQVVIKELCKPDAKELSIWAQGMIMGKHNLLSHNVPTHEDPMTFFKRVGQTFTIFTTHSPKAFRAELHRASLQDVFISGLPDYLKRVAEDTMRRVGVLHHSEDIVNAFLVKDTQNAYEHVLRHETKEIMHKQASRMLPMSYVPAENQSMIPFSPEAPKAPAPYRRSFKPRVAANMVELTHADLTESQSDPQEVEAIVDSYDFVHDVPETEHLASHSAQFHPRVHPRGGPGKGGRNVPPSHGNPSHTSAHNNTAPPAKPYTRLPPNCFICSSVGDHYADKCPHRLQYMQYAEQGKKMMELNKGSVPTLNAAAHATACAAQLNQQHHMHQQMMQRDAAAAQHSQAVGAPSHDQPKGQMSYPAQANPASHSVQAQYVASLYEHEDDIEGMMNLHAHTVSAHSLHASLASLMVDVFSKQSKKVYPESWVGPQKPFKVSANSDDIVTPEMTAARLQILDRLQQTRLPSSSSVVPTHPRSSDLPVVIPSVHRPDAITGDVPSDSSSPHRPLLNPEILAQPSHTSRGVGKPTSISLDLQLRPVSFKDSAKLAKSLVLFLQSVNKVNN